MTKKELNQMLEPTLGQLCNQVDQRLWREWLDEEDYTWESAQV